MKILISAGMAGATGVTASAVGSGRLTDFRGDVGSRTGRGSWGACRAGLHVGWDGRPEFSELGIVGYGFAPLKPPPSFDYHALFHGVDERVPVEALRFGVRVLDRFLSSVS